VFGHLPLRNRDSNSVDRRDRGRSPEEDKQSWKLEMAEFRISNKEKKSLKTFMME